MPGREAVGNHIFLRMAALSPQLANSFSKTKEEFLSIRNCRHRARPWLLRPCGGDSARDQAHFSQYGQPGGACRCPWAPFGSWLPHRGAPSMRVKRGFNIPDVPPSFEWLEIWTKVKSASMRPRTR